MSEASADPAEKSITAARFRAILAGTHGQGLRKTPIFLGTFSDGSRYVVYDQARSPEFYLVTDLSNFRIVRLGQVSLTTGAGGTAVGPDTISPVLSDATLTNWRAFATPHFPTAATLGAFLAAIRIVSTSQVQIVLGRPIPFTLNSPTSGLTAVYPSDTQTDIGAGHQHATDSGGLTLHSHNVPAEVPTYGTLTVNVDWMIIHI